MNNINLSDDLILKARQRAEKNGNSITNQIEHWAKIGRIAEDNPDLTYHFIEQCLDISDLDKLEEYIFGSQEDKE